MARTKSKRKHVAKNSYAQGVDIVMPVHGELEFLTDSIPALKIAAEGMEVSFLLGETGSAREKDCRSYATSQGLGMFHSPKPGYLGGCNYLAAKGNSEYILITTPDVTLEPDAIKIMKQTLEAYEDAGICAPLLLFAEGSSRGVAGTVQHAGMESNVSGEMIHIFIGWNKDHPKVQEERRCLTCTGATFMIRRAVWQKLKGFDTRFGLGTYEDQDLCMGVNALGMYVHYQPQAVGHHFVGASSLYSPTGKYEFPLQRNRILFAQKWNQVPWTDWEVW